MTQVTANHAFRIVESFSKTWNEAPIEKHGVADRFRTSVQTDSDWLQCLGNLFVVIN